MYDVIIIGAGPSGMTSALYALRNGKSVLVLEQENFGGQIANSPRVENLPSIKVISGSDFADQLLSQITDLGAEVELERVEKVEKEGGIFTVTTEYGQHQAKAVILAVGVKHRHMNLPKEEEFIGKGISYCALCDGAFYKGEEVTLIGDANTALQYAILLSNYCTKVKVMTLFDKFFADAFLIRALRERENIEIRHEVELIEYLGEDELTGLRFRDKKDGSEFTVDTRAAFIAIGQIPDNKLYVNLVDLDKAGYIIADENCTTKTAGVFAVGDCRTKKVRQVATAVADGAVAGTAASLYIDSQN